MQQCIKNLFRIYMKLNMFRATHRHHQEPKTAQAASGFAYVCKTRGCLCSFSLLMMGGVSSET
jgi:hypothetical protein